MRIEDAVVDTRVYGAGLDGREISGSGTAIGSKPRVASVARDGQSNVNETDAPVEFQVSAEAAMNTRPSLTRSSQCGTGCYRFVGIEGIVVPSTKKLLEDAVRLIQTTRFIDEWNAGDESVSSKLSALHP